MSDVIIVGGGPAGACLAILLGRSGLEVELYDQAHFPREKPCGEGMLPMGVNVLRTLGLEAAVAGEPLGGVRYHVSGGSVRSGFADAGTLVPHGLGQRRLHLDGTLWAAAARTPGVRAFDSTRVDAPLFEGRRVAGVIIDGHPRRARLVVAADGSGSPLRRKLGLERTARLRRVGIRAHFQRPSDKPRLRDVEVFMRPGYELYVTPLPNNEILVAALAYDDAERGNLRAAFRNWLNDEPALRSWLEDSTQTSEFLGRAPLVSTVQGREPPGLVFLGDAASSVDPITAGGISLALVSAELLAKQVPGLLLGSPLALRRFRRERDNAVRVHRWLGAGLLVLGARPRLADTARRVLVACPGAMGALVQLAGGV